MERKVYKDFFKSLSFCAKLKNFNKFNDLIILNINLNFKFSYIFWTHSEIQKKTWNNKLLGKYDLQSR